MAANVLSPHLLDPSISEYISNQVFVRWFSKTAKVISTPGKEMILTNFSVVIMVLGSSVSKEELVTL